MSVAGSVAGAIAFSLCATCPGGSVSAQDKLDKMLTASNPASTSAQAAPKAGEPTSASDQEAAAEVEDLDEDVPDFQQPPPLELCKTDLRLSGTVYDARHPERSFAMFHVRAERSGEVYRVGERVGAFGLRYVWERTVVLDDGAAGCYLKLAGAPAPAPRAAKPAKKKPAKKKKETAPTPAFSKEELDTGIRSLGTNKYELKRELIAKVGERASQLMRNTEWKNVQGHSNVTGVELTKLMSGDLLERLGLRTGDELRTLNGLQLSNAQTALEAQTLLTSATNLSLLIQRDGAPVTLDYTVVR
jgi:general secretion pathway protein C